ncbi:MAG: type II toxin-antitoxin system PemK/MazF family toxin [Cryobacterium sp.]
MSRTRRFLAALRIALVGTRPPSGRSAPRPAQTPPARPGDPRVEPGASQSRPGATTELDPAEVRRPGWGYAPDPNGALDPGEIVWTWVPYEERDGRGKDRPVVVMATLTGGAVLAVQLTSKDHIGDADFVPLGVGDWDRDRRPSWAAVDRVFRVSPNGVRREGTFVDAAHYTLIERALRTRYGWY